MNSHRTARAVLSTLAALMLSACSDDPAPSTSDQPSAADGTTTVSPSSTGPSTAAPSSTKGAASGYQRLGPTSRVLEEGRWAVTAAGGRSAPLAVLDLPEGLNGGAEYVWSNDGWIFGYWTIGGIYSDPCTQAGGSFDHVPYPDIWVEALEAQRRTTASVPVQVTVGGYDGLYVELTAPESLELGGCRKDRLTIFKTARKGDDHWIAEAGVVERYWFLDVDGERVVLTGAVTPETTDSQIDQLTEVVESVQFVRS